MTLEERAKILINELNLPNSIEEELVESFKIIEEEALEKAWDWLCTLDSKYHKDDFDDEQISFYGDMIIDKSPFFRAGKYKV